MINIAIVGLGVVGASFAMGLVGNEKYNLLGIDISQETVDKALDRGLVCKASTDPKEILDSADITVICIYPSMVGTFVKENASHFKEKSVLMDVTGIKLGIINEVSPYIPAGTDFIFAHPMAGREKRGIDYASADVNKGANFLITKTPSNKEENIELIKTLASDVGFGKITIISPEHHDEMIAFTSQLPHALAVALINSDTDFENTGKFIGDSYRDLTRIAAMNEELWSQLFLGNKSYLIDKIECFEKELGKIKTAVTEGDDEGLQKLFISSTKRREKL